MLPSTSKRLDDHAPTHRARATRRRRSPRADPRPRLTRHTAAGSRRCDSGSPLGTGGDRQSPSPAVGSTLYGLVRVEIASLKGSAVAVAMLGGLIGTQTASGAGPAGHSPAVARHATRAPRCVPANLSATFGGQGATQSLLGAVRVTNHGRGACTLHGRPTIAMRGGSPHEALLERAMNTAALIPRERFSTTLIVDPGHSASAAFQWFNWCDPQANASPTSTAAEGGRPSQIRVRLAAGTRAIVATVLGGLGALYLPVCGAPRHPSLLYVSLWTAG
jgi:hypothetical protein